MFYWIKSLILAVFLFAGYCQLRTLDQKYSKNPLHHSMSVAELKRYFGTKSVDEVPQYEVTHPFLTNEHDEFLTYKLSHKPSRHRRNTADKTNAFYFHLNAFGLDLHLNMSLNENLLGHKFSIETRHKNGSTTVTTQPSAQHFLGDVVSHPRSTVAISYAYGTGMNGVIKLMHETFFLQPVPTRLAKSHRRSLSAGPHIIFKKSAEEKAIACDQEEQAEIKWTKKRVRRSTNDNQEELNISTPHKYIKTIYIVDKYIADYMGVSTLTDILPIVANIVAGIFRDDSFGEIKVNYVLNKIIILNNSELSYPSNASSVTKLYTMMEWAKENLPKSDEDPNTFDTLTLISRGGDVGGRGTLGTICTGNGSTANIVNIAGINSAGIIAHEVFHNFGYNHDGTTECPDSKYIMATVVSSGAASFTWSKCSSKFAQNFLSSGASECLDDSPSNTSQTGITSAKLKSKLPGVVYDADRQCELQYGIEYKKCPSLQNQCGSLYCTSNGKICRTSYAPPLDGTRCGIRHWCIEGLCVDDGSPIIDGKWGEWSDYGSCSRTCGGGIEFQTRKCDSPSPQNGGLDCEGNSRGYFRICNTQACPERSVSFRQVQCAEKGAYVEYTVASDRCSLTCSIGSAIYWLGKLKDGTRCFKDKNILDVCVEGLCKKVGCDHNLESGKRFDRCRVCGGDGNSCGLNIVNYTKIYRGYGFGNPDTMVALPVHSTSVVAIKKGVTFNMLGVQSVEGEYLINLPSWSKTIEAAGTTISYIHEDNKYQDRIYIPGPTTREIKLVFVFLYENNHGVDISYYSPVEVTNTTNNQWHVSDWSECSRTCAGGLKTRDIKCLRNDDKTEVGFDYCDQSVKPDSSALCNIQACAPQWYVTSWKTCSLSCGKGSQSRSIVCRQKINENEWETLVDESVCSEPKLEVSPLVRNCNQINCPPEYVGGKWSTCSTTCSSGVMTRNLECQRRNAQGVIEVLPDHWCQDYGSIKPATTENCNMDSPCEPPAHFGIACFQLDTTIFPTVLANFQETLDYENVFATALACSKLASKKNYEYFGLANDGECRVGPDLKSNFFKPPISSECNDFVGKTNAVYVYTLAQLPRISPIGCYADTRDRALPILLKSFRDQINWHSMNKTVNQCARVAHGSGYPYFAVQFYGECWTGTNANSTYNKHGESTECWEGVGKHWANFVYKLE